jgi:hypothetical protein
MFPDLSYHKLNWFKVVQHTWWSLSLTDVSVLSVLSSSIFCDNSSKAQCDVSRESGTWLFDNVPNWSENTDVTVA